MHSLPSFRFSSDQADCQQPSRADNQQSFVAPHAVVWNQSHCRYGFIRSRTPVPGTAPTVQIRSGTARSRTDPTVQDRQQAPLDGVPKEHAPAGRADGSQAVESCEGSNGRRGAVRAPMMALPFTLAADPFEQQLQVRTRELLHAAAAATKQ